MAGKKAKDLNALIRLNGWIVDERRRELGVLQAREDELLARREALARQMIAEQKVAAADPAQAGTAFGGFAGQHRLWREALAAQLAALRTEIEAARDRLADAYRQLKVYEEVQNTRATIEAKEEAHREQAMLDEVALNQYRRRLART